MAQPITPQGVKPIMGEDKSLMISLSGLGHIRYLRGVVVVQNIGVEIRSHEVKSTDNVSHSGLLRVNCYQSGRHPPPNNALTTRIRIARRTPSCTQDLPQRVTAYSAPWP